MILSLLHINLNRKVASKRKEELLIPLTTPQMIKASCLSITLLSSDEDSGDEVNPLPNKHSRMESSEIQVSSPIHTVDSPESKPIKEKTVVPQSS